jgi:hypothetical protein
VSAPEKFQFPICLHPISAALHMLGVNPGEMVIELPFEAWWAVRCEMDRKFPGVHTFDGRGDLSDTFQVMGVKFRRRQLP